MFTSQQMRAVAKAGKFAGRELNERAASYFVVSFDAQERRVSPVATTNTVGAAALFAEDMLDRDPLTAFVIIERAPADVLRG